MSVACGGCEAGDELLELFLRSVALQSNLNIHISLIGRRKGGITNIEQRHIWGWEPARLMRGER